MKKRCKVYEEIKSEISPENVKVVLQEMEDALHRESDRVEVDEDNKEIKIEGLKGKLCKISGTLNISSKKGKSFLEGEIEGKPDTTYWIIFGVGMLLFVISIFAFWPLLLVSIAIDVVIICLLSNSVKAAGKMLGDKFHDSAKNI